MERIGPGTLLAGRYRLRDQVRSDEAGVLWRAEDLTLERPVAVRVLDRDRGRVQATLDAARRAALVDEPRLQRVLGVGVEAGSGYVVLEWVEGEDVRRLAAQVGVSEALRIATDTAEALRTAATRDLHHGRLGPEHVVRKADGRVRVTGTGVDAAATGQATPAAAARPEQRDLRDVAAVLYALLTGRWPFGAVGDLPAAPTDKGRPVPASNLREDVPAGVDRLLQDAFAGDPVLEGLDRLVTALRAARAGVQAQEEPTRVVAVPPGAGAAGAAGPQEQGDGGTPGDTDGDGDTDGEPDGDADGHTDGEPDGEPDDTDVITPVPAHEPGRGAGLPVAGAAGAAAVAAGAAGAGRGTPAPVWGGGAAEDDDWSILPGGEDYADDRPGWDQPGWDQPGWDDATWASSYDEHGQAYDPAYDPAYAGTAGAAGWDDGQPWPGAATAGAAGAAGGATAGRAGAGSGGAAPVVPGARPPGRRRPAGAGAGVAVVLVMGAVVVGALVYGLDRLREGPEVAAPPAVTETVTPSESPSAEPSPEPSAAPAEESGPPEPRFVSPAGVQPLDPFGDGEENDQDAPRAIDGDPSTSWTTQRYNSQAFGGLKDGLGLAVDLGEPRAVTGVSVLAPGSDGSYEVRTADDASFEGSTEIGSASTGDDEELVELDEPVETQFVVIWFTELPDNDGDWRALVSEVQVQVTE